MFSTPDTSKKQAAQRGHYQKVKTSPFVENNPSCPPDGKRNAERSNWTPHNTHTTAHKARKSFVGTSCAVIVVLLISTPCPTRLKFRENSAFYQRHVLNTQVTSSALNFNLICKSTQQITLTGSFTFCHRVKTFVFFTDVTSKRVFSSQIQTPAQRRLLFRSFAKTLPEQDFSNKILLQGELTDIPGG